MIATIYVRSIVGTVAIAGMLCYLQATDVLVEAIGGIVALAYIDKQLSGDSK